MDPLTRGSLFHRVQAEFYRALEAGTRLPVTRASAAGGRASPQRSARPRGRASTPRSSRPRSSASGATRSTTCGAISASGCRSSRTKRTGSPKYFEFSFGLNDEGRDPRSLPDPVIVDGRFLLRGSVDLIEHHRAARRPAGHRSQDRQEPIEPRPDRRRRRRAAAGAVQRGGRAGSARRSIEGRLFYCTTAGGFAEHAIPINDYTRGQGLEVLTIVDRAVEQGFLRRRARRARVHLVRLPAGVRPARGGARRKRKAEGSRWPISRR